MRVGGIENIEEFGGSNINPTDSVVIQKAYCFHVSQTRSPTQLAVCFLFGHARKSNA